MQVSASSYIIYLFHTTFEGFAKSIIRKLSAAGNLDGDVWFAAGAVIVIATGVVAPVLLHKYLLTKSKATKILFGLK